jgi:hypothetical protein
MSDVVADFQRAFNSPRVDWLDGVRGRYLLMTVVEFTCRDCSSFETIPVEDLRRHLARKPPFRCPDCDGPVSVEVLYDFEPSDNDAWLSALTLNPDPDSPRRQLVS